MSQAQSKKQSNKETNMRQRPLSKGELLLMRVGVAVILITVAIIVTIVVIATLDNEEEVVLPLENYTHIVSSDLTYIIGDNGSGSFGDFTYFQTDDENDLAIYSILMSSDAQNPLYILLYRSSDLDDTMSWAELTLKEFEANVNLFHKIDKDLSCPQIIIRPHPAEDHMEWNRIAKTFDKIKVIYEGSIIPWIYAAKALLHRGCASSVQAYMAGIP
ncbi:MAG: hypothetical protein ACPG2Y_01735, partial [Acholeplasmataceae bacterium]